MGMQLAVIGSGYVGLVAAIGFAELAHNVICVDADSEKISALRRGECPIHERFLPELLSRHRGKRIAFTNSLPEAVRQSSVIIIAVGTPATHNGEADLSYVERATAEIARSLQDYKIVVQKSTVPVTTGDWMTRLMLLNGASPECFDVVCNPEFLREGTAITDFLYPDRIIIGTSKEKCARALREIYRPLSDGSYYNSQTAVPAPANVPIPPPLIVTSTRSAELIKHASNAFLAMKVSFINAVSTICGSIDTDAEDVCRAIGLDSRIGERFLKPGIGFGGSFCKDLMAFRAIAREHGYDFRLLEEVIRINEEQRHQFLRKVHNALWTLKAKRLAVLGLAFKGGTDDIRESPAIPIIEALLREGAEVVVYDPAAMEHGKQVLPGCVGFADNAYEVAKGADAMLILTDWPEFATLDFQRLHTVMKYSIIIDGRNLYDPEHIAARGFEYFSIGRPVGSPRQRAALETGSALAA
jgi:UDPglucose 6-dehydrogenase